ncbi:hypothetical protein XENTR_v10013293 [Xenopus tropicalis]|nr:hypothetical protein XENTR_v10013293 [Xenopus tropicalis]
MPYKTGLNWSVPLHPQGPLMPNNNIFNTIGGGAQSNSNVYKYNIYITFVGASGKVCFLSPRISHAIDQGWFHG